MKIQRPLFRCAFTHVAAVMLFFLAGSTLVGGHELSGFDRGSYRAGKTTLLNQDLKATKPEKDGRSSMDLAECLIPSETLLNSKIDWDAISSLGDLEACILAVGVRMADPVSLNTWIGDNGFVTMAPISISKRVMLNGYGIQGEGIILSGTIPKKELRLRLGLLDRLIVHSLSVGVILNDQNIPVDVSATLTRK